MQTCSKISYLTQRKAEFHLRIIARYNRHRNKTVPTGSYFCPYCRAFHLTSHGPSQLPPWQKQSPRRKRPFSTAAKRSFTTAQMREVVNSRLTKTDGRGDRI